MGYWDATDVFLEENGGPPTCPTCGNRMFPADDHGRFTCFCSGELETYRTSPLPAMPISQVDATSMSDGEKAKIPPIHRLNATATSAETKVLSLMMQRMTGQIDEAEYQKACAELEKERNQQ